VGLDEPTLITGLSTSKGYQHGNECCYALIDPGLLYSVSIQSADFRELELLEAEPPGLSQCWHSMRCRSLN